MTADVANRFDTWSTSEGSNAPLGNTIVGPNIDDNFRMVQAKTRTLASSTSVASAATCDIGAAEEVFQTVTGTTTITAFGSISAGIYRELIFAGVLTLTHNATSLICVGGASITTAAGDTCKMLSLGSGNWRMLQYTRASGNPLIFTPSLPLGLVGTPSLSFIGDSNTGLYSAGADQMNFTTNGTLRMSIANTGVTIASGVSITAAGGFVGPLTGAVTGNTTGLHTGNVAGCTSISGTGGLSFGSYSSGVSFQANSSVGDATLVTLNTDVGFRTSIGSGPLSGLYGDTAVFSYGGDVSGRSLILGAAGVAIRNASASGGSAVLSVDTNTASGTGYDLIQARTTVSVTPDVEFKVRADGTVFSDGGTSMTTPADYAEMFEWADGNPDGEDRVGRSVALVGNMIKIAEPGDHVIGIVSGNPAVLGDAGSLRWVEKYVRDEFNRPVYEDFEVLSWDEEVVTAPAIDAVPEVPAVPPVPEQCDEDGNITVQASDGVPGVPGRAAVPAVTHMVQKVYPADALPDGVVPPAGHLRTTHQRRKVNPLHDAAAVYVPRLERPEWSPVGLVGKLRVHVGEQLDPRWLKLRDIAPGIEEYLVR